MLCIREPSDVLKAKSIWLNFVSSDGALSERFCAEAFVVRELSQSRGFVTSSDLKAAKLDAPVCSGGVTCVPRFSADAADDDEVDESGEDEDEEATVTIGGTRVPFLEVTQEMIARMTPSEKDHYIKIGQEMYKDMYE